MKLETLIEASHSNETRRAYEAFEPTEDQYDAIIKACHDTLTAFPNLPGACVLISSMVAHRLEALTQIQAFVVAGALSVKRTPVFGNPERTHARSAFTNGNMDWDGHAWVMFGPYLADASIFRTAHSRKSPPLLASHIRSEFGTKGGAFICEWRKAPESGLRYSPQYVLTDDEMLNCYRGAMTKLP